MKNKKIIELETDPVDKKFGKGYLDEITYSLEKNGIYEKTNRLYYDEKEDDYLKSEKKIASVKIHNVEIITYSQIDEPYYIVECSDFNSTYNFFGNSNYIISKFQNVLNITTSNKLTDVFNEIISSMGRMGIIKKTKSALPDGIGLFFNDDHVKSIKLQDIINKKNKPKQRKQKAKNALKELDKTFNFYSNSKKGRHFLNSIYATGLYSIFSFLRKQKGLQTPSVLVEGSSNTGKTAVASIVLYTYGVNKKNRHWTNCSLSGSDMRKATLDKLSKLTIPVFFDESKNTINKISGISNSEEANELSEMLKIASDGSANQPVRSVMTNQQARITKEIYCTRTMFFISNYSITEFRGDAWKKRILIFESDASMSKNKEKASQIGRKLSSYEFQNKLRDLGEWIIYDLILGKSYSELSHFLKNDFFESSKYFYNYIRKELGFDKVEYQEEEDIWDSQQNLASINMKEFIRSKIDSEAERVKKRLRQTLDLDEKLEKEYNKRNIVLDVNSFQKSLADNILICMINDSLSFLKGLSTQPTIILMKNSFISSYSRYANYIGKSDLENGVFEKTFLRLKSSEKKTKDSFRVDGQTMSASTIRLSFYDFLNFLSSKHDFENINEEDKKMNENIKRKKSKEDVFKYINSYNKEVTKQEIEESFGEVENILKKLLDEGRIVQIRKGRYYAI